MSRTVLVIGEPDGSALASATAEAVTVARRLAGDGGTVAGFVAGSGARSAANAFGRLGVGRVWVLEDGRFDTAPPSVAARAIAATGSAAGATVVLVGGTTFGRELTGALAVAFHAAAANGATEVEEVDDGLRVRRPVFGGRATETRRMNGERAVLSLRPHAFPASEGPSVPVSVEAAPAAEIPAAAFGPRRIGVAAVASSAGPSLADAAIVVSGGRGLRSAEEFHLVEELAGSLGAAVGASRAVTDAGWRPAAFQVGQTGKSVSPQLYVAVGISGAIQHLVGMSSARVIVAINSDSSAPIFRVADYGIVGDLFTIVPALTAEVRRVRAARG